MSGEAGLLLLEASSLENVCVFFVRGHASEIDIFVSCWIFMRWLLLLRLPSVV